MMFEERRRQKRVDVDIPIRVQWSDGSGGSFEEVTRSTNVSADGAIFLLKQALKMGTPLQLSLPLPRHMQRGGSPKAVYEVTGLVVRIEHASEAETFRIAVRFRGATRQYRSQS